MMPTHHHEDWYVGKTFTADWTSPHFSTWETVLGAFSVTTCTDP